MSHKRRDSLPKQVHEPFEVDFPKFKAPIPRIAGFASITAGVVLAVAGVFQKTVRPNPPELYHPTVQTYRGVFALPLDDVEYGRRYNQEVNRLVSVAARIRTDLEDLAMEDEAFEAAEVISADEEESLTRDADFLLSEAERIHASLPELQDDDYRLPSPSSEDIQQYNALANDVNQKLSRIHTLSRFLDAYKESYDYLQNSKRDYERAVARENIISFVFALIAFMLASLYRYTMFQSYHDSAHNEARSENMKRLGYRYVYEPPTYFGYKDYPAREYWVLDKKKTS